jgi:hypothetical protein
MYITGSIVDFEKRLHQLPTGQSDFTTGFLVEGSGYSGQITAAQLKKWNNEFQKIGETILNSEKYYSTPALSIPTNG